MERTSVEVFDELYRLHGVESQRKYPNEALIKFISGFKSSKEKPLKVLEVGCGSGANLWMLAKEGFETYGCDSSELALELANNQLREKWNVQASLQLGKFESLPYENEYFDIVVDVLSLEHVTLESARQALGEVNRVLKPAGKFFSFRLSDHSVMDLNVENSRLDFATIENISNPKFPFHNNGPISFWSPSLTRSMYGDANLKVMEIELYSRTYPTGHFVEYLSISGEKADS